ncbi:MAG: phosphatase PAP2 family protein [Butyrivibrio sp.]|nr:phosphatase PAP2 family protein [Butyrivibrio sp.]
MKKNSGFLQAGIFLVLFFVWIVIIKTVDVAAVGPEGTEVGLSTVNVFIHGLFHTSWFWYELTQIFGVIALLVCAVFAVMGLVQLIKRKSLLKVDREILILGGLYAVTIALYALFEKVVINYRPIIMPDNSVPEASFPSSHTMLIIVVMGSLMPVLDKYVREKRIANILKTAATVVIGLTVAGRMICGVHWFTDIIGGIILSAALLFAFKGVYLMVTNKGEKAA